MKKIIVALTVAFVHNFAFAQYDPDAKNILDAMSNKYKSIPAFSATFKQNLKNDGAGLDETMEGKITVMKDMYKLEIAGQEIYNDGTDVWSYSSEINEVTVSPYDPDESEISLGNIWDIYKEGFKYVLLSAKEDGANVIDLDPENRDKSYYKIRMVINNDNTLNRFTVFEQSGNQYTYSISDFETKNNLSASDFTFDVSKYPDVEVIDFR